MICSFLTGNSDSAVLYDEAATRRLEAIESVLWDAERGAWFDYNLVTHSRHFDFHPSNLSPVWAQCYSQPEMGEKAVKYLKVGGHPYSSCGLNKTFLPPERLTGNVENSSYTKEESQMSNDWYLCLVRAV